MIKLMLKYKWYLIIIIALMIIEPTINSVLNFWLQKIFNSASPGVDKLILLRLLTGGFLLWMLKRIVSHSMNVFRDRYICNMKADIKHTMFMKLLFVNTANLSEGSSSGEFISMFTNDILLLEQRFLNQIVGLISGIFSVLIMGYSFVALNSTLALIIIGFGVLTMLVPVVFSKSLNTKNTVYTEKIAKFTQKLKEYLVSFPTIKNYSIEPAIEEHFSALNRDTENSKFEADCAITLANSVGQLSAWFMQFIGVGLGLMLVIKGEILIGTVIAAQAFANDLATPLQSIIININSIRSIKNTVRKLDNLAEEYKAPQKTNNTDESKAELTEIIHAERHDLRFENILLKIGQKNIVDNFSFNFESGKKYLVVGLNGSGKSSVFKLLKKWYRYCEGEITINGKSINEFSSRELSQIVSYLNENVSLFSGSVKDNIILFRDYDKDSLSYAVSKSHMELDLNRQIIDEGRNISSGEQRRIEIARSLLKSASILIFDEVVSTLDIETAYDIEKNVLQLQDKTVVFISHNFSGKLIGRYDEILVMNEGRLEAHGTYEELLKSSPYFKRICEIKFG